MAKKYLIILILLFLFTNHSLYAYLRKTTIQNKNVIEKIEFGIINWTRGVITIYGKAPVLEISKDILLSISKKDEKLPFSKAEARQQAKKKAYANARQNLYNAILNLRIKNDFYIKSYLIHSTNNFKYHLNDFISANTSLKYSYHKSSIRVELKLKLFSSNGLITVFTNKFNPELISFLTVFNYNQYKKNLSHLTNILSQTYTSLIIDASELTLKPALFPALYNENGKEIFSTKIVPENEVIKKGLAVYIPDVNLISKYDFIDSKAFIIKAVKTKNKTDLILPDEETMRFLSNMDTVKSLQKCNVLIILNR